MLSLLQLLDKRRTQAKPRREPDGRPQRLALSM
jgi:hypothetical protein